jgi:RHH-type rel operon transcriptional repressor/antitoxin RelB
MLGVRLDEKLEKRLALIAAKTGRTKSYYLRKALEEKIEDFEDMALAIERLESPQARIPLDDVLKNAGLDD